MNGFKHKTAIPIRFKDIDVFRHVNNAVYFTYLEIARSNYCNKILGKEIDWIEQGLILAKAAADYKTPILLSDQIFIYTRCSRMGNKSFDLSYLVVKEENHQQFIACEAHTVLVSYNYKKLSSIPVPEKWKEKIHAYEK
jgi:acyl-CoA thioester hydrolase